MHGVLERTTIRVRFVNEQLIRGVTVTVSDSFVMFFFCGFKSPVIVGPVLFMGGMWGYPGGPIMDMLCLESM